MLKNYLKIALKVLGRNKFFTFISLFGISVTLAILLVITTFYDHLTHPKYPETNRERCLYIHNMDMQSADGSVGYHGRGSLYFMDHYLKQLKTPERVALASRPYSKLTFVEDRQLSLNVMYTCEDFWGVHEFNFLEGGPFLKQHINDNETVAVISEFTRDAYFGKGKLALDQWIEVDKRRFRVIGVVENVPTYQHVSHSDLYAPYNTYHIQPEKQGFTGDFVGIIMAANSSEFPAVQAELEQVVAGIEIPESEDLSILEVRTDSYLGLLGKELLRKEESELNQLRYLLFGGMFLFMLLPALNLVNLNSSRIMERAPEIGVRKAFGATSSVLTMQFIIENTVLSLFGGILGLLLGWILLQLIEGSVWMRNADLNMNFGVLLIGLGLTLLFALLSGVLPARRMSRLSIVNAIKEEL